MHQAVFFIFTFLYLVLSTAAVPVNAQEVRSVMVSPPTIKHSLNPSEEVQGQIKIFNLGSQALYFTTDIKDFIVKDEKGTPDLLSQETFREFSARSWLSLSPKTFTLLSKEEKTLTYFLKVPKEGKPGGHYAALVFTPTNSFILEETGASVEGSLGVLFYISVKGAITEKAVITKFTAHSFQEYGPVKVTTTIRNLGNIHIQSQGNLLVSDLFGKTVQTERLSEKNIFPQSVREYQNLVGKKYMFGRFKVTLTASFGQSSSIVAPLTASLYFWIVPWKIILVTFLIIVILSIGILRLISHKPPMM